MILIAIPSLIGYIAHAARIQETEYRRNNEQPITGGQQKKDLPKRRTTDGLGTINAFDGVVFEFEPPLDPRTRIRAPIFEPAKGPDRLTL